MTPKRHPNIPFARVTLGERDHKLQLRRGIYTIERGEPLAIPNDKLSEPGIWKGRKLWVQDEQLRVFRPGVRFKPPGTGMHKKILTLLRDKVNSNIPYWYYLAVLGHDLHVSTWGDLYARHWHAGWTNPFNPDEWDMPLDPTFETNPAASAILGFTEELGWISGGKVTDAFVSEEIDELVSTTGTEYADFDFHEVGTSTQAENNNDTALITTTGIARATGTPTDSDPIYQNVGTITADTTESFEEHVLANNSSGATIMDRSLTGGQGVDSGNQVEYTYQLTKNPEA